MLEMTIEEFAYAVDAGILDPSRYQLVLQISKYFLSIIYIYFFFKFLAKYSKLGNLGTVHLYNGMLFDFGMNPNQFGHPNNSFVLNDLINEVNKTFDLIMIVEYFKESMILLKNGLSWNFDDMSSLRLNVHDIATKSVISDDAKKSLRSWLNDSYVFYDFFKVFILL